jgi:hypothetical protein
MKELIDQIAEANSPSNRNFPFVDEFRNQVRELIGNFKTLEEQVAFLKGILKGKDWWYEY